MKKILLALIMLVCSGSSFALTTYAPTTKYYGKNNALFDTKAAACASFGEDAVSVWRMNADGSLCQNVRKSDNYVYASKTIGSVLVCKEGDQLLYGTTCAVTETDPPPPPPPSCPPSGTTYGTVSVTVNYGTGSAPNAPDVGPTYSPVGEQFCAGNCTVMVNTSVPVTCVRHSTKTANGYYPDTCDFEFRHTGAQCAAGTPAPGTKGANEPTTPSPGENKCPSGTISGGIDPAGIPICIGNPKPPTTPPPTTTKPPTTTTNADGSTTTKQDTVKTNADGSTTTTTTTTTTAADGTKTVTVSSNTTAATNGTPGKPDVPDEQKDLCQKNPNLTICQNSTVAGTCGNVTCNGDAIQCALLRTQSERNCRDKETEDAITASGLYAKGSATANGNDPNASTLPTKGNASSVSVPAFDNSGWLGGGACFPDKTFSVQGRTITLSFTSACQPLLTFRYALMIVASLIAFRMFSGTILKD